MNTSFQALWIALHRLRDSLRTLALTVGEDHPAVGAVPQPVQRATEDLEDLLGRLQEAIAAVTPGLDTAAGALARPAIEGLGLCHDRLIAMTAASLDGITSRERSAHLATVAADRGGRWRRWNATVSDGVARYSTCLVSCHRSVLACWADVTTVPADHRPLVHPTLQTEEE
jgi:hypothetical protein